MGGMRARKIYMFPGVVLTAFNETRLVVKKFGELTADDLFPGVVLTAFNGTMGLIQFGGQVS
jgi:hypothetical protein